MSKRLEENAKPKTASMLDRRAALSRVGGLMLAAGTVSALSLKAAPAAESGKAVALGHQWIEALNKRDVAALSAILSDNFLYSAMLKNPPEMMARWSKEKFLGVVKATADATWKRPVVMKVVSEFGAGDRAVIEAEGDSELADGYVYANVYCFNFWTEGGKITGIHDYCCTHTAWLLGQHMRETAKSKAS